MSEEDSRVYTPEQVRELLINIEKLRQKHQEQDRLIGELAHSLIAKVAEKVWVEYHGRVKHDTRCKRCSRQLNGEHAYLFDGSLWHIGNCVPRSPL